MGVSEMVPRHWQGFLLALCSLLPASIYGDASWIPADYCDKDCPCEGTKSETCKHCPKGFCSKGGKCKECPCRLPGEAGDKLPKYRESIDCHGKTMLLPDEHCTLNCKEGYQKPADYICFA